MSVHDIFLRLEKMRLVYLKYDNYKNNRSAVVIPAGEFTIESWYMHYINSQSHSEPVISMHRVHGGWSISAVCNFYFCTDKAFNYNLEYLQTKAIMKVYEYT